MAGANRGELACAICMGEPVSDALVMTRLLVFVTPILTTPFRDPARDRQVENVVEQVVAMAHTIDPDPSADRPEAAGRDVSGRAATDRGLFRPRAEATSCEEEAATTAAFDEVAHVSYPPARRAGWFA